MVWHALGQRLIREEIRPVIVTEQGVYDLDLVSRVLGRPGEDWSRWRAGGIAAMLDAWTEVEPALAALADNLAASGPKFEPLGTGTKLCAPYRPVRIFATASNYVEHAQEMGTVLAAKSESQPFVFMKADSSVIGPDEAIILPQRAQKVDWEVELAAVIGIGGRDIPVEKALDHVAAYTVINDISDRKFKPNPERKERKNDSFFDWLHGKWHDSFCPCGPCIVSAAAVPDPQKLKMKLSVSGKVHQDASTAQQIFPVAAVIEFISNILTLEPGDIIATGTPAGVGNATGTYLHAGDQLEAWIENIGTLSSPVKDE